MWREWLPRLRVGDVLLPKRNKPVVSAHKQIVAADAALVIKWWPMTDDRPGQFIPDKLRFVRNRAPSCQRTRMDGSLGQLLIRAPKLTLRLLLIIAAPVHMIKSQVPNGAPTVRD